MRDVWQRVESALAAIDPKLVGRLGPPAPAADIAACEAELGFRLPPDFRDSLLVHGGDALVPVGNGNFTPKSALGHLEWLRPNSIASEWRTWRDELAAMELPVDPWGPVRKQWWNPKWIPISVVLGSTYHHCLDLDPDEGGTVGQIIEIGMKEERRIVVADGFGELLLALADDLAEGAYALEDEVLQLQDDAGRTLGGFRSQWYRG